ncbi:hypothetical protein, partial [Enterobacter hormaechei]
EHRVAEQAALLTERIGRPVQLTWPRGEDMRQDRYRPPAIGRLTGKLNQRGQVSGLLAKVAAPETGRELATRLLGSDPVVQASLALPG